MTGCTDCTTARTQAWHGFSANCDGCTARGLGRIFLGKGERGRKLRLACEQAGVTVDQVKAAHQADHMAPVRT